MSPTTERYIVPKPLQPYTLGLYRLMKRIGVALQSAACRVNPRPVLVLGNQKSGTTVIAAAFARLTGLTVTLDLLREVAAPTFHRIRAGELTFDRFVRRNKLDFSRQVIKEGNLTLFYPELKAYFPDSPMVFVLRDPRDNIRSILNRLQLPGDLPDLREEHLSTINEAWRLVLDNRWLGVEAEHYIDQLAARWCLTAQTYLDHAEDFVLIRYEDFLADKVGRIHRLAHELRLPPVNDIADMVDMQFQPRGDRGVLWDDFFGRDNLGRIHRICGATMERLGYRATTPQDGQSA